MKDFLVKAKKNTYASFKVRMQKRLEDGSKEFLFKEGNFIYRDRYFGSKKFVGEEIVFKNEKAVWSMNYFGGMLSEDISSKNTYNFLKKTLMQVSIERPFRGPKFFEEGDFIYKDKSVGGVDNFSGTEEIFYKGNKIYELKYHGGFVVK